MYTIKLCDNNLVPLTLYVVEFMNRNTTSVSLIRKDP